MKTMFHWAKKNDMLDYIPNIDAVSSVKIIYKQRHVFTSKQIHQLFEFADVQMKAMIWLGLNCGFGCTDCAELKWSDLDFVDGRVKLARGKTGVPRDLPLWPETIQSLENIPKSGKLVFYTSGDKPLIRTTYHINKDGSSKYPNINPATSRFCKLMKKAGIRAPKGTGFYTLQGNFCVTLRVSAAGHPSHKQQNVSVLRQIHVSNLSPKTSNRVWTRRVRPAKFDEKYTFSKISWQKSDCISVAVDLVVIMSEVKRVVIIVVFITLRIY